MIALIFLGVAVVIGIIVFRLGLGADWHWAYCVLAALVPIAFTFFLGIIGLIISAVFAGAVYKATG